MKTRLALLLAATAIVAAPASAGMITVDPLTFTKNLDKAAEFKLGNSYKNNVLVDFTLRFTGTLEDNSYAGLYFGALHTGPSLGLKANCGTGNPCKDDVYGRTKGEKGSFIANSNLSKDTTYHIVGYLQKTGGSTVYNKMDVWLDPASMVLADLLKNNTKHASFADASTLSAFSTIGIRTYKMEATGRSVTIDDIRISAVPEPGSLALLGLGAVALVRRRARK